jgi:hypothetical protein
MFYALISKIVKKCSEWIFILLPNLKHKIVHGKDLIINIYYSKRTVYFTSKTFLIHFLPKIEFSATIYL